MATESPLDFARRKIDELTAPLWTPHEYPLWAVGLSARSGELLDSGDEAVAAAMDALSAAVEARRSQLVDGSAVAADSQLAIVRQAMDAPPAEFWWLW